MKATDAEPDEGKQERIYLSAGGGDSGTADQTDPKEDLNQRETSQSGGIADTTEEKEGCEQSNGRPLSPHLTIEQREDSQVQSETDGAIEAETPEEEAQIINTEEQLENQRDEGVHDEVSDEASDQIEKLSEDVERQVASLDVHDSDNYGRDNAPEPETSQNEADNAPEETSHNEADVSEDVQEENET